MFWRLTTVADVGTDAALVGPTIRPAVHSIFGDSSRFRLRCFRREEIFLNENHDLVIRTGQQLITDWDPTGLLGLFHQEA